MSQISVFTRIKTVIRAILLFFSFPIFVFCFLPIYFLRYLTSLLKRIIRPSFGKLLSARSCIFATDKIWTNPTCNIVSFVILKGEINVQDLRTNFTSRILQNNDFPEFFQYPSQFLGFDVWVPEMKFSVEEHIRAYDGPITFDHCNEQVLFSIIKELTHRPFTPKTSPWEINIVPNYAMEAEELDLLLPRTVFILRLHHCLADGFSVLQFLQTLGDAKNLDIPTPRYHGRSTLSSCLHFLTFPFRVPYDLAMKSVLYKDKVGVWNLPEEQLSTNNGLGVSDQIPLAYVKEIRKFHKVTTAGVILTAISGALRRVMLESEKEVPRSITILTVLPVKRHLKKMRNHMGPASSDARFLDLPVLCTCYIVGPSGIGIGISSITSNGYLRLLISINENIVQDSVASSKQFVKYFPLELDALSISSGEV